MHCTRRKSNSVAVFKRKREREMGGEQSHSPIIRHHTISARPLTAWIWYSAEHSHSTPMMNVKNTMPFINSAKSLRKLQIRFELRSMDGEE